jgi:hypothetical protein
MVAKERILLSEAMNLGRQTSNHSAHRNHCLVVIVFALANLKDCFLIAIGFWCCQIASVAAYDLLCA